MAGRIILDEFNPAIDANGEVDAGCTITFYQNLTTTPQPIYSDSTLNAPLANPLPCNAAGRFPNPAGNGSIWAADGATYTIKVEWSNGDIATRDDVTAGSSLVHEVPVFIQGGLSGNSELYPVYLPTIPLQLPSGMAGSRAKIRGVAPTALATFLLFKNDTEIGSVAFATDKSATFSFDDDVVFSSTDDFYMTGPNPADATISNIAFNFQFIVL